MNFRKPYFFIIFLTFVLVSKLFNIQNNFTEIPITSYVQITILLFAIILSINRLNKTKS